MVKDDEGNPVDLESLEEFEEAPSRHIDVEFLTGAAGTGKSFEARRRVTESPEGSVILSATTGIAAVNMGNGVTTTHSLLKFFNHQSLQDAFISSRLQATIRRLADDGVREILIDEISMLSGPSLDLLYAAFNEIGAEKPERRIKLTLTGDFCQLPPIPEKHPETGRNLPLKWAFDADSWPEFSAHTTRLTKIWRQTDSTFLESLQALRRGDGSAGLAGLQSLGVAFRRDADEGFDGTTLRAKNEDVDRYNRLRLMQLEGKLLGVKSHRWGVKKIYDPTAGKQPGDWKLVPERFEFKIGALVMILSNLPPTFEYVNGDLGTIEGLTKVDDPLGGDALTAIQVKLKRNDRIVNITRLTRRVESSHLPDDWKHEEVAGNKEDAERRGVPYKRVVGKKLKYVLGEVNYFPLRLGWSTSVHKSQGLSLDAVQIDLRSHFIGSPSMCYVATSRCRTPQGLLFVGEPGMLIEKCAVDPRVKEWL